MANVAIVFLCGIPPCGADSWPGPQPANVFSGNGEYFVRIVPGESTGDTVGFAGAAKGRPSRGEFYARQSDRSYQLVADVELQNPVAPVDSLVSNQGYLLTFDNWHNVGYGKVVAIYRPSGKLVAAYNLEELYEAERLESIPRSVSSRWWRCTPHGFSDPEEETKVYVFEYFGGTFVFELSSGKYEYNPGEAKCYGIGGAISNTAVSPQK